MKSLATKSSEGSVTPGSDIDCRSPRTGLLQRILRQTPNPLSTSDSLLSDPKGRTTPKVLQDIRSRNFAGFSDANLRNALAHLKSLTNHYDSEALLPSDC